MKKHLVPFIYTALLISAGIISGCNIIDEPYKVNERLFHTSFEDISTRTYLEDGGVLLWHESDLISLFAGNTLNRKYQFDGKTGDNSGTFSIVDNDFGTGAELNANYAIYPYKKYVSIEDSTFCITLPSEQMYAENSFGIEANTMVAVTRNTEDTFLKFKNIGGYLKLRLYGNNTTVSSITLYGNSGERIAGEAEITASFHKAPKTWITREGTKYITLKCGDNGIKIGSTIDCATDFWFVVPPTDFTKGISVKIITSEGREINKSTEKNILIERNIIKPMAPIEIKSNKIEPSYDWYTNSSNDTYIIDTVNELYAFSKLTNGDKTALSIVGASSAISFQDKVIDLRADIDMSECCSYETGTWTPIGEFMGTFNGNGFEITNIYCDATPAMGLFSTIRDATIRDLTVSGEYYRKYYYKDGNMDIGGIASRAINSTLINCVSKVDINTVGPACPISVSIGGICGVSSNSYFIACQSSSDIKDEQSDMYYGHYIGGIVGSSVSSVFVACLKTQGDVIQVNKQAYGRAGGIVGMISNSDRSKIRACYTDIHIEGRQPGHILGSMGMDSNMKPDIIDCYYSGTGKCMSSSHPAGIGSQFYGGSEQPYDYGTQRSADILSEITNMNNTILNWNSNNPNNECKFKFTYYDNQVELTNL